MISSGKEARMKKVDLGGSDIGTLILAGFDRSADGFVSTAAVSMGSDGGYTGFVCTGDEVPEDAEKVFSCQKWLRIYDDVKLRQDIDGEAITVYRESKDRDTARLWIVA